jgi:hypothetical protein
VKPPFWAAAAGGVLFCLLATANGAGYRYGTSDQAFYVPAVVRALDPQAFPRDRGLIDAQGRFMVFEEIVAAVVRTTSLSVEAVFLGAYLLSIGLFWTAAVLIGSRMYRSAWAVAALGAALTLRHRIPRTSANSLEPYFHPRILAFALGALAVAAVLRRRHWAAVALVGVAAISHVTTALWFAVLLGVAIVMLDPTMRKIGVAASAAAVVAAAWGFATGRL